MKAEPGYCLVCEKEIASRCSTCNKFDNATDYTEVELKWSNGSRMRTAVCMGCAPEKVWKADKHEMTQAIWDAWDKQNQTYDREIVIVD